MEVEDIETLLVAQMQPDYISVRWKWFAEFTETDMTKNHEFSTWTTHYFSRPLR